MQASDRFKSHLVSKVLKEWYFLLSFSKLFTVFCSAFFSREQSIYLTKAKTPVTKTRMKKINIL
ncbi:hypothetical protein OOZ15_03780 [Galbibacter sp. EGI 63066]|uniref:hypothetical protein n=1 Tax=Galbibacter sp. EGI 63066 TaxID=2993559 RepID=UPI002248C0FA|nr:hypothetical protein [Galbibacter sp. EGI 63066]MCX2679051.1 hypothetical protein [Galbibacter sp. EGI 63066]